MLEHGHLLLPVLCGAFMLRLSVLLGAVIYVTLLVAGNQGGPLRPGLARAVAEGDEIVVLERRFSETLPAPDPAPAPALPAPPAAVVTAAYTPAAAPPAIEPAAEKPAPVFTLSVLPTIGGDTADPDPALAVAEAPAETAPDDFADGTVWYVTASSVNVRQGPSTETSVVGKLTGGEAVTVLAMDGSGWARILIEGDGIEGYVAARFLTPEL
jgi:hypothetical protein